MESKGKATKAKPIETKDWLECYLVSGNSKKRPSREFLEKAIHLTKFFCRFVL